MVSPAEFTEVDSRITFERVQKFHINPVWLHPLARDLFILVMGIKWNDTCFRYKSISSLRRGDVSYNEENRELERKSGETKGRDTAGNKFSRL